MDNKFLEGPEIPALGGNAKNLVIFMHGLSSDGSDLIDLVPMMQPALPDTHFISPNAIEPYDMAAFGYQWFSLQDRRPQQMYQALEERRHKINTYIMAKLEKLDLKLANLALVGFSQGTMTALHIAPRLAEQINCVVGFSGRLIAPDMLREDIKVKMPVCLIHGAQDEIVPIAEMRLAAQALQDNDIAVQEHNIANLCHSIDSTGLKIATNFLKQNLYKLQ